MNKRRVFTVITLIALMKKENTFLMVEMQVFTVIAVLFHSFCRFVVLQFRHEKINLAVFVVALVLSLKFLSLWSCGFGSTLTPHFSPEATG